MIRSMAAREASEKAQQASARAADEGRPERREESCGSTTASSDPGASTDGQPLGGDPPTETDV